MRALVIMLISVVMAGCTSSYTYICGDRDTATATMPKTVDVSPEIQGNVPIQGGTVTSPTQTAK